MWLRQRLQCNSLGFIVASALFFTVFQNALFLHKAWSYIRFENLNSVIFAASMPVVIFCALNMIFSVLTVPYLRKPLIILLLLGSATANYFMFSYGVVIDGNMMQNAFETNPQEATALLTPRMGLWLMLLGVLPAVVVCFVTIRQTHPWWYMLGLRAANVMLSAVVILLIAALFYKDYASLLRNNKSVVKMLTPSDFIAGTLKFTEQRYFTSNLPLVSIGKDAHKGPLIAAEQKKTLVVLVVGETARAENFSLGGYARETNPRLKQDKVIYFQHASSCGTETAISVPCMFSNMPRSDYDATLASHQEGMLDVLAHAGVNVLWRENDGGCKGACDRVPHIDMTQLKLPQDCDGEVCMDNVLLYKLNDYLNSLKGDGVIVLHQMGSHGPAYYRRSTAEFRRFTPTCDSNQIQDCSHQQLVNTYDNSLLYTDAMLDNTIKLLQQYGSRFNTAMIYLSDHGESLGENGMYLHGTPYMFAPSQQTHIPMLLWMSDDYQRNFAINRQCLQTLAQQDQVSQDNLFHTLLGMLNIQTDQYQPQLDILQRCRSGNA
ncbi:phosphoethanolamine transferase EptA [Serratia odorifera]|uniref:Phosphoethanolamine transferase EptA n=2 Tax=Serratia odorifera TaxID=618 RepID=D4E6W7_SEROD|nr:phosphoethanolamine transferase EptA [Serratia odorifera]EFE94343.1 arylsulfatase [Serratia odorifera DSM 4582]MBJ2065063.1 phosphoethanolamine transferase EptA [Serratia odorifera]PNK89280.1 phosphoethanolamine transferase EptA [Serratia odorifera]RII70168.1 phosphoethanolamine transferase EptA [Serratia odorifera]VDZ63740.1 Phosphoethanolamine transferase eptA [Serratia odorifera]